MKNQNICKFILTDTLNELNADCFVLETSLEVMTTEVRLQNNRAVLVERGEGNFLIDGKSYAFCSGTLIFAFAGESFCVEKTAAASYFYIDFNGTKGRTRIGGKVWITRSSAENHNLSLF